MTTLEDRRRKRSEDPLIALHYQLAHARHDGELEAIVLADNAGIVVAGAGSWAACEELAAYAPLLAQDGVWTEPGARAGGSTRMESLKMDVEVRSMDLDGQEVFIAARGGWLRTQMIDRAARGVSRILKPAA